MISDPVYDAFVTKALAATSVDAMKAVIRDANEYVIRHHWVLSLIDQTPSPWRSPGSRVIMLKTMRLQVRGQDLTLWRSMRQDTG